MDFRKITDKDLGKLEQGCERYAIMAFEALNECLAIGLKSIIYSYDDHASAPIGCFTATFIPKNVSDCPKKADRHITVECEIHDHTPGMWCLADCIVTVQGEQKYRNAFWSEDGKHMVFRLEDDCVTTAGATVDMCREFQVMF